MTTRDYSVVPRGQFGFIDLLRGPAALLVLYSHYVGIYLASIHQTYWLKEWVNTLFVRPLVIVDQFGQLGVMVFFLISGFIITHVARSENVLRFGIRRVFRIYPGYWLIAIIVIAFGITGTGFSFRGCATGRTSRVSPRSPITSMRRSIWCLASAGPCRSR